MRPSPATSSTPSPASTPRHICSPAWRNPGATSTIPPGSSTLRPGITFQNGQPLTGEDVAFTIARIPRVPNALFTTYTGTIDQVTQPDPLTVRLHTKSVDPLLPLEMTQVKIISHIAAATAETGDFNSGRAAIGTGPFRLVKYLPGDRVELERNDGYWGAAPQWQHVIYRTISNDAARTPRCSPEMCS